MLSKHFTKNEIACHCCGKIGPYPQNLEKLLAALEKLRRLTAKPVIVTSAYRCPRHNAQVGGIPNSYHTQDLAADFYCPGVSLTRLEKLARQAGFSWTKIYQEDEFVHADCRT